MAFPDDWAYSQAITIDNTKVSGSSNHTNFPVPVTLDHLDTTAIDAGSASMLSADEIRFTSDSDGLNELACQVLQCTPHATASSRRFLAWVKIPTLSYNSDTIIYIWYRNAAASAVAVGATYGRNNVWSRYRSVHHLNEAAAPYIDSTGNGYDATNKLDTGIRKTTNHPIDDAYWHEFDTYNHSLEILSSGDMLTDGTTYMISGWHYNRWTGNTHAIMGNWNTDGSGDWRHLFTNGRARADNPPDHDQKDPTSGLSNSNVYHSVVMHTASKMQLLTNGSPNGDITPPAVDTAMGDGADYLIGTYHNGTTRANADMGMLRTSIEEFSNDWFATEYESIKNSSTFASAGTPVPTTVNNEPTGSVSITGTLRQGETITITDNLADVDGLGSFTYAWLRDDVVISGATGDTYDLTAFDVGTTIKSRISYTDGEGNAESEESAGVGLITSKVETTYQDCYFTLVTDHVQVAGPSTFLDIPLPVRTVHVPTGFFDGGSSSAANGGGNIEVHKAFPFTGSTRIPAKIVDFDINAGTIDFEYLHPSLSAIAAETLYIRKVNADQAQPAADEAYGSDLVDNAVTFPDNADLATTLANAANNDDFYTTGPLVCTLVGGVTPSDPSDSSAIFHSIFTDAFHSIFKGM